MGSQAAVSLPAVGADESERFASDGKRVLVVGAGGIGCELLKDLLLTGVQNLEARFAASTMERRAPLPGGATPTLVSPLRARFWGV